jgi:hypothetical protein
MVVHPDSTPYQAENLLSGVSRPERWTNIWVSDDQQGLPAWVRYDLGGARQFDTIHLTFDTNLNLAHMSVPGLYRAPTCVRDYKLLAHIPNGAWKVVATCVDNYQRKRIHTIERGIYDAVKLEISATNGDPSARLYEMRIYDEGGK